MRRLALLSFLAAILPLSVPERSVAQGSSTFLPVGAVAPDVHVAGATRHGVLSQPVKLSDLRGETVVLAFFFKTRTGG